MRPGRADRVDPVVFSIAATLALAFVLWGVIDTGSLASVADSTLGWIIEKFGWAFVLSTLGFLIFAVVLGVSRYGHIRLARTARSPSSGPPRGSR